MNSPSSHKRLVARLDLMKSANAQGFDPPAFAYIEAVVMRSKNLPRLAQADLEEMARYRLSEYQTHFNEARAEAEALVEEVNLTPPDREIVDEHFRRCDFRGCVRYVKRRMKDRRTVFQKAHRAQDLLATFGSAAELAQLDLLAELESEDDETADTISKRISMRSPLELLKEHAATQKNRLALGTARQKKPELAGPLNSQTLATQLLEELEVISPIYVKRIVSHLEIIRLLNQVPKPKSRRRSSR